MNAQHGVAIGRARMQLEERMMAIKNLAAVAAGQGDEVHCCCRLIRA